MISQMDLYSPRCWLPFCSVLLSCYQQKPSPGKPGLLPLDLWAIWTIWYLTLGYTVWQCCILLLLRCITITWHSNICNADVQNQVLLIRHIVVCFPRFANGGRGGESGVGGLLMKQWGRFLLFFLTVIRWSLVLPVIWHLTMYADCCGTACGLCPCTSSHLYWSVLFQSQMCRFTSACLLY